MALSTYAIQCICINAAVQRKVPCSAPGRVCGQRVDAAVQQGDDLAREAGKVDEDTLLVLEALEVFLADLQGVQEEQVALARDVDAQDLRGWGQGCTNDVAVPGGLLVRIPTMLSA